MNKKDSNSSNTSSDTTDTTSLQMNQINHIQKITQNQDLTNSVTNYIIEIMNEHEIRELDIIEPLQENLLITRNSIESQAHLSKDIFITKTPPITLEAFLKRIIKYTKMEDSTMILMLVYLDRYCEKTNVSLNDKNVHRLMFFSVMAAIKYNEDEFCKNSYYALVAGLPVKEFNYLEQMFMRGIDYSLYVSKYNYDVYESYFIKNE